MRRPHLGLARAAWFVTLVLVVGLALAALIYWRKADDVFGVFSAIALVLFWFSTNIAGPPLPAIAGYSPALRWLIELFAVAGWVASFAFICLFPDGRFAPRWLGWLLSLVLVGNIMVFFGPEWLTLITGQPSAVAEVVSTLAIADAFFSLRRGIQSLIDRRFYRGKYDAAKTLATFAATARDETDLDRLTERLMNVVKQTMQPESIGLWLPGTGDGHRQMGARNAGRNEGRTGLQSIGAAMTSLIQNLWHCLTGQREQAATPADRPAAAPADRAQALALEQRNVLVDPRLQWSEAKNIWQNAAVRTGLYMPVTLFRKAMGRD